VYQFQASWLDNHHVVFQSSEFKEAVMLFEFGVPGDMELHKL
jgi:hypothetical protein